MNVVATCVVQPFTSSLCPDSISYSITKPSNPYPTLLKAPNGVPRPRHQLSGGVRPTTTTQHVRNVCIRPRSSAHPSRPPSSLLRVRSVNLPRGTRSRSRNIGNNGLPRRHLQDIGTLGFPTHRKRRESIGSLRKCIGRHGNKWRLRQSTWLLRLPIATP